MIDDRNEYAMIAEDESLQLKSKWYVNEEKVIENNIYHLVHDVYYFDEVHQLNMFVNWTNDFPDLSMNAMNYFDVLDLKSINIIHPDYSID